MRIAVLLPLAVSVIVACDTVTDTGGATGTPALRIAGQWSYDFSVTDGDQAHCETHGNALITQTQNGDQFSGGVNGVFNCTDGSLSDGDQTALVAITAGELAGTSVRFIAFGCVHIGSVSGSPPDHASGTLNCTFPVTANGPTRPFSGSWSESRQ